MRSRFMSANESEFDRKLELDGRGDLMHSLSCEEEASIISDECSDELVK